MGASLQGGRGRGGITGINVTPLVDVVLVLLVIMMVSATYIVSQSLKVDLPKTASSDESTASPAMVTITAEGALHFNQRAVSDGELSAQLRAAYEANHDLSLVVNADHRASHGRVVHVIDLAKTAGITHFAISVEREAGGR
jgi:biopolymer transport protein ExbD